MEHTAKNFVLQLGSLVALYVSLSAVIMVAFGSITVAFPDAAAGAWEYDSAQSSVRFGIAMLLVFFPTYLVLTRLVNGIRRGAERKHLALTRWLIYLSLLIGGLILLGDVVAVIHTYLGGEISSRFLLKALTLLVVIGAAFTYYANDARGYWIDHEDQSKMYGAVSVALVLLVLVLGFFHTDTPAEVREARLDQEQVYDLQDMQWRIEEYYRVNRQLPASLEDAYGGLPVPVAPDQRAPYTYDNDSRTSYELCATFETTSVDSRTSFAPVEVSLKHNQYTWDHGPDTVCFERVIDTALQ